MDKAKGFISKLGDFFLFLSGSEVWNYIKSIMKKISKTFLNKKDQAIIDTLTEEGIPE